MADLVHSVRVLASAGLVATLQDSQSKVGRRSGASINCVSTAARFIIGGHSIGSATFDALILAD